MDVISDTFGGDSDVEDIPTGDCCLIRCHKREDERVGVGEGESSVGMLKFSILEQNQRLRGKKCEFKYYLYDNEKSWSRSRGEIASKLNTKDKIKKVRI